MVRRWTGVVLLWCLIVSLAGRPAVRAQPSDEPAILAALDAFLDGWNSRDAKQYASALHFPHLILEAGGFRQWETEAQLVAVGAGHWANVQPEWDKTVWEDKRIVQRIGDTAHVTGRWVRLDRSGRVLQKADVLYVVLRKNGKWAIFARSGSRAAQRSAAAR